MRLLILLLCFLSFTASAKKIYEDVIVSEVTSIYDADTFRVNIEGYPAIVGERVPIRVLGVDAPEIRGKCQKEKELAREAKQFTVAALRGGNVIELQNIQRGKYFRLLADVYIDGKSLAKGLISSGHARPYDGSKRLSWCNTK